MSQNIEQRANRILKLKKISSSSINAELLAEFRFGLDFDCCKLSDTEPAGLNVSEKKIYMNELLTDKFAAYLLMPEIFVHKEFTKLNSSRFSRGTPVDMNLDAMAYKFCVSRQAMRIRLSQAELDLRRQRRQMLSEPRSFEKFLNLNLTV